MMREEPEEKTPLLGRSGKCDKTFCTCDDDRHCSTSWLQKVRYFLDNITVEPILFFHSLSYAIDGIFYTNMIIDKTCKIQLNYSNEICVHLDSGNYTAQQDEVQKLSNTYQLYSTWVEYALAMLIVLFLGTWSDVHGRKLPVITPLVGSSLKALGLLINAYFWSLKPFFIVLSYIPYGLCGGTMTIYMATYAFIGDDSSKRARTTRLSVAGVMMFAASPIGHGLGTILYSHGGYILVFGIEFLTSLLSVVYGLLRLKGGSTNKNDRDIARSSAEKKMSFSGIRASTRVVIKKREDYQRAHIIGHICCIWIYMISFEASNFTFLYTRKKFQWNYYSYTLMSIVTSPASFISSCILLPILSYHYQIEDAILGFAGSASHIFYGVLTGTAPSSWVLYLALVVSSGSSVVFTSSRGALSKLVATDELGAVFSIIAFGETIIPLLGKPLFNVIYNKTLDTYPGTIFLVDAGIGVIVCFLYTWLLTSGSNKTTKEKERSKNF